MVDLKTISPDIFIEMVKYLNEQGLYVEMETDSMHFAHFREIKQTEMPVLRHSYINGERGLYLRAPHMHFDLPKEDIEKCFPMIIDGYILEMKLFTPFEVEYGGDRYLPASITFTIKEYKHEL